MSNLTKKQHARKVVEAAAKEGFTSGFAEGGRYVLSLLMGIPRPSAFLVDPKLEPGFCVLVANPRTDLQRERIEKLGEMLDALRSMDIRSLMSDEVELSAGRRLEDVVRACDLAEGGMERAMLEGEQSPQEWATAFIEAVRSAARGEK